ncbi:hemolymph lipopolysaccharide-binding protein [Anabrus simplex]|uniref:hemolymph lipopolysaccharide-binding protein n=1 Tax=Anabrus simplex TaxID=316456 RepID=UPI0035A34A91
MAIIRNASGSCGISGGSKFNLSVSSHRNMTGHWNVAIDLAKEDPYGELQRRKPKQIGLFIDHETATCDNSETVHISAKATVSGNVGGVPADYEQFFGLGYYKLHTAALTWLDAQTKCTEEGAHLIIVNSAQEADVISTLYSRGPKPEGATPKQGHLCYVGFHDHQQEGQFVSVLGSPLSKSGYVRWGNNQPSGGAQENCLVSDSSAIYWDAPCSWKLMYICEYKS